MEAHGVPRTSTTPSMDGRASLLAPPPGRHSALPVDRRLGRAADAQRGRRVNADQHCRWTTSSQVTALEAD